MKISKYNIKIPQTGFVILYNSFTDKFLGVSKQISELLSDDGIAILSTSMPKQYELLVKLGFIIDDKINELTILRNNYYKAKYEDKQLYLMVYPTQDCNLKCWYCYESHKKGTRMSSGIIELIKKNVEKELSGNRYDSLHLGFLGGEPILDFSKIAYPLGKALKTICDSYGKSFSSFFVTNASLINQTMIREIGELNPYFQITLDGNKTRHDMIRIWKQNNKGTYDNIIKAIHLITQQIAKHKDSGDPVLTLRINYDNQTLKVLSGVLDDIKDIDRNKICIHFERVWQTRVAIDEEQKHLLLETFANFIKEGFVISHGIFKRKKISCPSDTNSFYIVNYDGTLHKCNGRTLGVKTKEGVLSNDGQLLWDKQKYDKRLNLKTFENPVCISCKMLPLCMGPCTQKMMEEGGFSKNICNINSIDIPINDYLASEFEMRYYLENFVNR